MIATVETCGNCKDCLAKSVYEDSEYSGSVERRNRS